MGKRVSDLLSSDRCTELREVRNGPSPWKSQLGAGLGDNSEPSGFSPFLFSKGLVGDGVGLGERGCDQPWAEHKSGRVGEIEIFGAAEVCEHKTWWREWGETHS